MSETFSIVIPVLNRASLIPRTLDSIRRQSYRPIRVIIVDNGSSDDSIDVAEKWRDTYADKDLTIDIVSEKRRGACAARNAGLKLVESRYMAFFDSDDTMTPNLVEEAVSALKNANTGNPLVAWKARLHIDGKTRILAAPHRNPLRNHLFHSILSTQRMAATTDLFRRAGAWNENLSCWNDWEFSTRILLLNPKLIFINKVLVDIHHQNTSITGSSFSARAGQWEKALKHVSSEIAASENRAMIPLVAYRAAILAAIYTRETSDKQIISQAKKILSEIKTTTQLTAVRKFLIHCSYIHTRIGLPGASRIYGRFL